MHKLLWLLLLLAPLVGHAGALEDAALNAFRDIQYLEHHENWEYGGIIVERDGYLMYPMMARTDNKEDSLNVDVNAIRQPGDKLVGLYHTHPCVPGYWTAFYSTNDLIPAAFWGVPTFMLDQCTHLVHEFEWGVDHVWDTGKTVTLENHKRVHLPGGRIVGHL